MEKTKKKGSALVLSILLLAFFMALSLNMFYIVQKKSQRAGFKVKGQKDFAGFDESSTLGYYELYLAGELVNIGSLFEAGNTIVTSSGGFFSNPSTYTTASGTVVTGTYAGIALGNYTEYFNSAWNITGNGNFDTSTNQAILASNGTSGSALIRTWDNDDGKAYRLWLDTNYEHYLSVGGYALYEFTLTSPSPDIRLVENGTSTGMIINPNLVIGTSQTAIAVYRKNLTFTSSSAYIINVTENIKFTVTNSAITTLGELTKNTVVISTEDLTEIIIEKQKQ